jgi:hypothetical protein
VLPIAARLLDGGAPAMRCALPEVTVETAEALCRDAEHRLAQIVARLEPLPDRPAIDLRSLYDGNLISGVVSGLD